MCIPAALANRNAPSIVDPTQKRSINTRGTSVGVYWLSAFCARALSALQYQNDRLIFTPCRPFKFCHPRGHTMLASYAKSPIPPSVESRRRRAPHQLKISAYSDTMTTRITSASTNNDGSTRQPTLTNDDGGFWQSIDPGGMVGSRPSSRRRRRRVRAFDVDERAAAVAGRHARPGSRINGPAYGGRRGRARLPPGAPGRPSRLTARMRGRKRS